MAYVDCEKCAHCCDGYGQFLCRERDPVIPVVWRRDPRSENSCGLEAKFFVDKTTYVPEPKRERWIPF